MDHGEDFGVCAEGGRGTWLVLSREVMRSALHFKESP